MYVYAQGNTSVVAGVVCSYDPTLQQVTILPTSGVKSSGLCVAMATVSATQYGWFMTDGQTNVSVDSGIVAGDFLIVPGTTAGRLTRYAAASPAFQNTTIYGITPFTAAASNLSTCLINNPFTSVAAAS
jgi:hypothetical protein